MPLKTESGHRSAPILLHSSSDQHTGLSAAVTWQCVVPQAFVRSCLERLLMISVSGYSCRKGAGGSEELEHDADQIDEGNKKPPRWENIKVRRSRRYKLQIHLPS